MTYAYFLTVALAADAVLSSKEEQLSLDLPEPIGSVSVKAFPGGVPISAARELRFHGVGFTSYECAAAAGGSLSDALRLTSVRLRLAIDVGDDLRAVAQVTYSLQPAPSRGFSCFPTFMDRKSSKSLARRRLCR